MSDAIPDTGETLISPPMSDMAMPGAATPNIAPDGLSLGAPPRPGIAGRLDGFEILSQLGAGGMGVVLLARNSAMDALVAIKLLRPDLAHHSRIVHRFLIEARHMYRMSHPHILKVLDVHERPEGPYYVMPYVQRGPLSGAMRPGKPLDPTLTLSVCRQIADALAYAHGQGVIHRDLKPANVLLDEQGHAFLSDFGLVRTVFNDSIVEIGASQCEGTAAYMSPAVAAGQAEDTRCDIYSFGAMLYELLTGQPPYEGRNASIVLQQILAGPPTPILKRLPAAPTGLAAIAEYAMARELRDRYATIADVAADLERVAKGEAPLGPHGRAKGRSAGVPTHRMRRLAWAIGLVVAAIAASVIWIAHRPEAPGNAAGGGSSPALTGQQPDRTRTGIASPAQAGPVARIDLSPALPMPTTAAASAGLKLPNRLGAVQFFIGHTFHIRSAGFFPDGKRAWSADEGSQDGKWIGKCRVWDIESGKTLWDADTCRRAGFSTVTLSKDAHLMLCGSTLRDADNGKAIKTFDLTGLRGDAALSLDGKRAAFRDAAYHLSIWDARSGQLIVERKEPLGYPRFTPDGAFVASIDSGACVSLYDIEGGRFVYKFFPPGQQDNHWSLGGLSSDGRLGVIYNYGPKDHGARIFDTRAGKQIWKLDHENGVTLALFSPDDKHVLTSDGIPRLWEVATGKLVTTLQTGPHGLVGAPACFSPDGRRVLAVQDNRIVLWDAERGSEVISFESSGKKINALSFSPDGALALSAGEDQTVTIWRLPTGPSQKSAANVDLSPPTTQPASSPKILPAPALKLPDRLGAVQFFTGNRVKIRFAGFFPDGRRAWSTEDGDREHDFAGKCRVWDIEGGQVLWDADTGHVYKAGSFPAEGYPTVAFSKDAHLMLCGNTLRDADSGKVLKNFDTTGFRHEAALSPDGSRAAFVLGDDYHLSIWDARSGQFIREVKAHSYDLQFAPDGAFLAWHWNGSDVNLSEIDSDKLLSRFSPPDQQDNGLHLGGFSSDSRLGVTYDSNLQGHCARIFDARVGKQIWKLDHENPVRLAIFSPDAKHVLTSDGIPRLWDVATGKLVATFRKGPPGPDGAPACFSPDGGRVLAVQGNQIVLWDAESGSEIISLEGSGNKINALAFSPDGTLALSAGDDATVTIWRLATGPTQK